VPCQDAISVFQAFRLSGMFWATILMEVLLSRFSWKIYFGQRQHKSTIEGLPRGILKLSGMNQHFKNTIMHTITIHTGDVLLWFDENTIYKHQSLSALRELLLCSQNITSLTVQLCDVVYIPNLPNLLTTLCIRTSFSVLSRTDVVPPIMRSIADCPYITCLDIVGCWLNPVQLIYALQERTPILRLHSLTLSEICIPERLWINLDRPWDIDWPADLLVALILLQTVAHHATTLSWDIIVGLGRVRPYATKMPTGVSLRSAFPYLSCFTITSDIRHMRYNLAGSVLNILRAFYDTPFVLTLAHCPMIELKNLRRAIFGFGSMTFVLHVCGKFSNCSSVKVNNSISHMGI
jgi:hypothetical protein